MLRELSMSKETPALKTNRNIGEINEITAFPVNIITVIAQPVTANVRAISVDPIYVSVPPQMADTHVFVEGGEPENRVNAENVNAENAPNNKNKIAETAVGLSGMFGLAAACSTWCNAPPVTLMIATAGINAAAAGVAAQAATSFTGNRAYQAAGLVTAAGVTVGNMAATGAITKIALSAVLPWAPMAMSGVACIIPTAAYCLAVGTNRGDMPLGTPVEQASEANTTPRSSIVNNGQIAMQPVQPRSEVMART